MACGRREDVEDAAPDRDLAPLLDHVHPGVGQRDQPVDQAGEIGLLADPQDDRDHLAQVRGHRLDHRPDRRDDHRRVAGRVEFGVREPPQCGQPPSDRVGPR